MSELLPCPFCGSTELVLDENGYKCKWVICDGCGATIDDSPHGDCVGLWNRRAAPRCASVENAAEIAELEDGHRALDFYSVPRAEHHSGCEVAICERIHFLASRSPAEHNTVRPADATLPVMIEALYHCGCPVGGMRVGDCAEQGVCGCSIRAERLKGCMGPDHETFPATEQQP